ncbi:DUF4232 domain-containing protein [Streptomyces sp. NPDC002790]|uniref:DUF4232 domain-containing protein n=1 Tax=Streptomyces sp. NPDC002790 TaxID=3154431 RepID=UPI003316731D
MSSIRNSRTRLMTAAATVALAALSLTACNDGTGVNDEGASAPSSSTASPTASEGPAGDNSGTGDSGTDPSGSGDSDGEPATEAPASKDAAATQAPADSKGSASTKLVTCTDTNTKTVAAPVNRPVNHMLLTVTNTGSTGCYLYGYPAVQFGEAQSVPPVIEDSQPQAVVTLSPGESGYSAVNLSSADGGGEGGHTEKSIAVNFQGRSGKGSVGTSHPALPAKGAYVDSTITVTYWQQNMDDALTW